APHLQREHHPRRPRGVLARSGQGDVGMGRQAAERPPRQDRPDDGGRPVDQPAARALNSASQPETRIMLIYQPPKAPKSIPVVDLGPSFSGEARAADQAAKQIHRACREMGFFYVSNHGIDQRLIDATFAWSAKFFELPLSDKRALNMKQSAGAAGYESG